MLLLLAHALSAPPPVRTQVQATASVRIERAATANLKEWEKSPKDSRREIVVRDERGQSVRVRVIDYQ
jgi:hypothetical protein